MMQVNGVKLSTILTKFPEESLSAPTRTANSTKWMPIVSCDQPANTTEAIISKVEALGARGIIVRYSSISHVGSQGSDRTR